MFSSLRLLHQRGEGKTSQNRVGLNVKGSENSIIVSLRIVASLNLFALLKLQRLKNAKIYLNESTSYSVSLFKCQ